MESCVYEGIVRHRRLEPIPHEFRNRIFMMYLDLAELSEVFQRRWFWSAWKWNVACLLRRDYHGSADVSLEESIRGLVRERAGRRPTGPIRLLTHLRYFGYCFNPVSFYYCFDEQGNEVEFVVVEITNTPWGERHCYVLDRRRGLADGRAHRHHFAKSFHVSPFMPMDHDYGWCFSAPGGELSVHMANFENGQKRFYASLVMTRCEISGPALARVLVQYPLMTLRVMAAIYWQALRLRIKKVPVYQHPKWSTQSTGA